MVHEISSGAKDFRKFFRKPENQMQTLYPSFEKPNYFDDKLNEI